MSSSGHHITDADREHLAQQEYSKSYADCDTHERRHIAGKFAASVRFGGSTGGGSNEHNLRSSTKASTTTAATTKASTGTKGDASDEEHERLAQAEYGCSYSNLDEHQRRHVGGKMAAETRAARQT